jgi:hypothetical protein
MRQTELYHDPFLDPARRRKAIAPEEVNLGIAVNPVGARYEPKLGDPRAWRINTEGHYPAGEIDKRAAEENGG